MTSNSNALGKKLYAASEYGDLAEVMKLVENGADVNFKKEPYGMTALSIAVTMNNDNIVDFLITKGVDVNAKYGRDKTALHDACERCIVKIVKALIDAGAEVNRKDGDDKSPLFLLIENCEREENSIEIIQYLSAHGADLNTKNGPDGLTALHMACLNQADYEVETLVDNGAEVNIMTNKNNNPLLSNLSPLYLAVKTEDPDIVGFLLSRGADVDAKNEKDDWTALHMACAKGNIDIIDILLGSGADIHAQTKTDNSALFISVINKKPDVVLHLLSKGANIESQNGKHNYTALHKAASMGVLGIVKILVEAGANTHAKTKGDHTPLDLARIENKTKVVTYLESIVAKNTSQEKWKGFSKSDIDKFDGLFDLSGSPPPANNIAVCPVCLKYVERSEACMYMHHNCAALGGYYHPDLYKKYKDTEDNIGWCTICGRICIGHNHYELGLAKDPKPNVVSAPHDPFAKDCRGSNGGGGLPEKFARFRRMREYAFELQSYVGEINESDALKELIEETWNAPLIRSRKIPKIMTEHKWNISSNVFPSNIKPTPLNVTVEKNTNDPTKFKTPVVYNPGEPGHEQNSISYNDTKPVIVFMHVSKTGEFHTHSPVSKDSIIDYIHTSFNKVGHCFEDESDCGGLLWPREVELALEDPKIAPSVTDKDREIVKEYRNRFFEKGWHKAKPAAGGRRRTHRRSHSHRRLSRKQK